MKKRTTEDRQEGDDVAGNILLKPCEPLSRKVVAAI